MDMNFEKDSHRSTYIDCIPEFQFDFNRVPDPMK